MRCEDFILKIDAYIDGELTNDELEELRAHAESCESCRTEMEKAEFLRDTLSNIDENIAVPLEAQAAWRKAVRAESKQKNVRKWTRGLYVVAAALVLVLGCTLAMNGDIFADKRIRNADMAALPGSAGDAMRDGVVMIAADGEDAMVAAVIESYSAVKKYAVADMGAADQLIRDLAAEYSAVGIEMVDLGDNAFYCIELPLDYQADFLSSLNMIGTELDSELFDVDLENAVVRINLVAE